MEAPRLWTTKKAAEDVLAELKESKPEAYLDLVERFGEADVNEAFDNTAPLRAVWVDRDTLLDSLREAEFLYVMVDDRLRPAWELSEELRG